MLYLRLPLMLCYTGTARSEFKETPLKSEVSWGNSCLSLNFAWLERCVEQQWGESCGALNGWPLEFWEKLVWWPLMEAELELSWLAWGRSRMLRSYYCTDSWNQFAPAAKLWPSASSVNVCICGAEGKLATVNERYDIKGNSNWP